MPYPRKKTSTMMFVVSFFLFAISSSANAQEVSRQEFEQLRKEVNELRESFGGLKAEATKTSEIVAFLSRISPPVGTIVPFAGEWPPKKNDTQRWTEQELGWMLCDGRELLKAQFGELAPVIGNAWGGNATNFNLPDLRGQFLRGVDDSPNTNSSGATIGASGNDPDRDGRKAAKPGGSSGNKAGSVQDDALQRHQHKDSGHSHPYGDVRESDHQFAGSGNNLKAMRDAHDTARTTQSGFANIGGPVGNNVRVADETRVRNAAVYYIIKVK